MKRPLLPTLVAAVSIFAGHAYAADGTINFQGQLTATTCTVVVNDQASPVTVTLPTVSTSQLTTAGQTTGQTGFNIQLTACSGTSTTASAFFNNDSNVDPTTFNLKNTATGGAQQVQLQLYDAQNGNAIKVGDTSQLTATSQIALNATGTTTLPYGVQYYATGATTPGIVTGQTTFNINYN